VASDTSLSDFALVTITCNTWVRTSSGYGRRRLGRRLRLVPHLTASATITSPRCIHLVAPTRLVTVPGLRLSHQPLAHFTYLQLQQILVRKQRMMACLKVRRCGCCNRSPYSPLSSHNVRLKPRNSVQKYRLRGAATVPTAAFPTQIALVTRSSTVSVGIAFLHGRFGHATCYKSI